MTNLQDYLDDMTLSEFIEFLNKFEPIEPDLSEIFDEEKRPHNTTNAIALPKHVIFRRF